MQDRVPTQFDDGAELISEVGAAMCTALDQGNAVVLIAIGTHRQLLETELSVRGIDTSRRWVRDGMYRWMRSKHVQRSSSMAFSM